MPNFTAKRNLKFLLIGTLLPSHGARLNDMKPFGIVAIVLVAGLAIFWAIQAQRRISILENEVNSLHVILKQWSDTPQSNIPLETPKSIQQTSTRFNPSRR
jgi:hypothetical protein